MENAEATTKCDNCKKIDSSLKRCAKCKSAAYCDRDCHKAHWKQHKKDCGRLAGGKNSNGQSEETKPRRSDAKPFTAIYHGNFLHDRSEEETFKILIDMLRMRQEDTYALEGDFMTGTIYDQEPTSEEAFREMLAKAKLVDGLLPPWWNDEKAEDCVQYGLRNGPFSLAGAQEKSDIQETWGDNRMPMKLRMLGEKVYGSTPGPGGQGGGSSMLAMMMAMEGGSGMHSTMLDMSQVFGAR